MIAANVRVLSNVQVSKRYWHMVVDSSGIQEDIKPGQFFNLKCGSELDPFLRRPFSIYRINKEEQTIEFLYLVKGEGTQRMTRIPAGDQVDVFGPLGEGFTIKKEWDTILLVARGVGIATLAALVQEAAQKQVKCIAILSARSQNDLLATEALEQLGAKIYKVTEEEKTSGVEYVGSLMNQMISEQDVKALFTCGSKRLSILTQQLAEEHKLPGQIAMEEHMACAMGVCFACVCDIREEGTIRSVRVCKEGPVFDLDKVVLV
ncbi:dihydroorotate dehydrogenase electron transfer subunit [Paenibacillus sp. R14(2021)]|uniref:dihydroorotate dehydrogenase electron transfer subunit n=1 Tax=Paenibacillus sp. R14(2021) TaxID=2859228 RepID=UPI0021577D32|nr:dihydroorotate dehydrogenase electron transfer subunit [Paenibacillus sp. R14(2021)]